MKKKKKQKTIGTNKKKLRSKIISVLRKNPTVPYNYKQIAKKLEIKDISSKMLISETLRELTTAGIIDEIYTGKYKFRSHGAILTGIIRSKPHGGAFMKCDECPEEVFISQRNLNTALNGDTVKVVLFARKKKARSPEGEVTEILKRKTDRFVGIVEISNHFAFLVPSNRNMMHDIFIPKTKLNGAKQGEKAIARITEWFQGAKNPNGEIIEILGKSGENETEMNAILSEFDLPHKFPEHIDKLADKIPEEISKEEIANRTDFRNTPTFTIDPEDAKDFDDALSIKKITDNLWEVGIHIADVSYYVRPRSGIEKEAYNRATSVYLVDRVVPMLPERLSNKLCSLRPNEDKLCFSAVFHLNNNAKVKKQWFGRTIIHSDRRFTYAEAQKIIDTKMGDLSEEVLKLHEIAQHLRKERFDNGSFSFERDELKFKIDDNGKPTGVYKKEFGESNQLIEEFMLLANKKVAEYIGKPTKDKSSKTFVYRIHDVPNPEKLFEFKSFISNFGYKIDISSAQITAHSMNKLFSEIKGKGEQNLIETIAIRSMAKAIYSTQNIGHYGLSFKHYTHFTSPIRRYPDLMVHRMLAHYLENGRSLDAARYEDRCKHSSDMEELATKAERASIKYKQVEFMQDKIGKQYEGTISGVTEWGLFVELKDSLVEGFIPIRDLADDYFIFDDKSFSLFGSYSSRKFQLGDSIRIIVKKADLLKKQLDFGLVE